MNFLTHLECSRCGEHFSADELHTVCPHDGKPLLARYDLDLVAGVLRKSDLAGRAPTLWRYRELLPVRDEANLVTLQEGFTPLLHTQRLGAFLGMNRLWVKDESRLPTGSFKARGMCMAVSRARELGAKILAVPSAGNAGGALAAYAAAAGMQCYIFMPADVPRSNQVECEIVGADVFLVRGFINDCGALVREGTPIMNWFDVSTLKEPYRAEGKKTMGLELAEQFGWELPEVVLYPTGGGTGLVGMGKAFDELERMGWIGPKRPRMFAVQAEGCAPIVRAFKEKTEFARPWNDPRTVAAGIRVPVALGDFIMLDLLRRTGGGAVTVSDDELLRGVRWLAQCEGLFACPEGGATVAALKKLLDNGTVGRDERVVLFNTGAGTKYLEAFPAKLKVAARGFWRRRQREEPTSQ